MLALCDIRTTDLSAFLSQYPSQANAHFLTALKNLQEGKALTATPHPAFIPDRKALWLLRNNTDAVNAVGIAQAEQYARAVQPTNMPDESGGLRGLPVYVPVAVADEVPEHDDEIAGLEERLLARLEEEVEDFDFETDAPPAHPDISAASTDMPDVPLFERFDVQIGPTNFGRPADRADNESAFVDWLTALAPAAVPKSPGYEVDTDREESMSGPDTNMEVLPPAKARKNKKGSKKKAKQLAKKSIKPDKNLATETLARILTDQGHYEEAIDMYERLGLLMPEKSAIFAVQIHKLKEKLQ